jgi:myxalamid-type polyketide synthase MxaD
VALAALWRSWGIVPDVVVGQSLGEVAAAHVAGALSLAEAIQVVVYRSRLMKQVEGKGKTAVVGLPAEKAMLALTGFEDLLAVAGSNSPDTSILSGTPDALERIMKSLDKQNVFCRLLSNVDIAFHSPQMDPIRTQLVEYLKDLQPKEAVIPIYSTVSGELIEGTQFNADYWGQNLREPFQFSHVIQQLVQNGYTNFVEIAPHPVLTTAVLENISHLGKEGNVIPSMRRHQEELGTLQSAAGQLYTLGYDIDWQILYPGFKHTVTLPTYPWQRQRYWFDQLQDGQTKQMIAQQTARRRGGTHPLLGEHVVVSNQIGQHLWETDLGAYSLNYLSEHRVQGAVLLPGTAYLEMVLSAARQAFGEVPCVLENVVFKQGLFLSENHLRKVQLTFTVDTDETAVFQIASTSSSNGRWTMHVTGRICYGDAVDQKDPEQLQIEKIKGRYRDKLSSQLHYELMSARGLQYGPAFQTLQDVWRQDGHALGQVKIDTTLNITPYQVHPTILDAGFQLVGTTLTNLGNGNQSEATYLPVGVRQVQVHRRPDNVLWCHVGLLPTLEADANNLEADIYLMDENGEVLVSMLGLQLQNIEAAQEAGKDNFDDWLYAIEWQPKELGEPEVTRPTGLALEQILEEVAGTAPAQEQGSWLIFTDQSGTGQKLSDLLQARGEQPILVSRGETYQVVDENHYQINQERSEDFKQLLVDALCEELPPCRGLVYLWGLDNPATAEITAELLTRIQVWNGHTTLYLMQAVAQADFGQLPRVWFVTRGAQPVNEPMAALNVAQSLLWGIGRVAAIEHSELWGGIVDLDPSEPAIEANALLKEIWESDGENQIAYRSQKRYVARLAHSPMAESHSLSTQFRADAAYLITGGFTGLGLGVARWMAANGARRLILMGRTPLPERSQWRDVSTDDPAAARIAAVRELEAQGVSVHVATADVGDAEQLSAFLTQYSEEGWPPIRGVFHSAGVTRDQLLWQMDIDTFNAPLRPKMFGAWLLHKLLAEQPLEFFVMFSSATSILGMFGQVNYAAGNAFMDALAHYRRAQGLPAISINWGGWAEIGIAARDNVTNQLKQRGMGLIQPEQGFQILHQLLIQRPSQVGVIPFDWDSWRQTSYPLYADFETARDGTIDPSRQKDDGLIQELLLLGTPLERQELIEDKLREALVKIMRMESGNLDAQQPLDTLGMDSIMAVELKNQIEESLEVTLSVVDLLQGASISNLAERILSLLNLEDDAKLAEMLAQIEELSSEEVALLLQDEV